MKMEDRNLILEVSEVLKLLGGNNGYANVQPKIKQRLIEYSKKLEKLVKNDILEG